MPRDDEQSDRRSLVDRRERRRVTGRAPVGEELFDGWVRHAGRIPPKWHGMLHRSSGSAAQRARTRAGPAQVHQVFEPSSRTVDGNRPVAPLRDEPSERRPRVPRRSSRATSRRSTRRPRPRALPARARRFGLDSPRIAGRPPPAGLFSRRFSKRGSAWPRFSTLSALRQSVTAWKNAGQTRSVRFSPLRPGPSTVGPR